ncbi:MAG: hypothetical protein PF569_04780 [Candidatus Woesearchaeota archaeon]|jgi:hypothetical protein|nr:hypothetical protein [Candidatus Woesearchaeota archaeon]
MKQDKINKIILTIFSMLLFMQISFAALNINYIQYDPAIIAAGDEVDIIIQFEDTSTFLDDTMIGNDDYTFKVTLTPDDDISREYITILDSQGDDLHGTLYAAQKYNKVFRVKVAQDAPSANYQFELVGQWYKNGVAIDSERSLKFEMDVKKEGIILEISKINTLPAQVRPGDKFVEVKTLIENVGSKDAKSIEIQLNLPENTGASYSDNNRQWIGRLNAGENREVIFFINLEDEIAPGIYDLDFNFNYMDLDDNTYTKDRKIPLLVKPRSYLEIEKVEGEGLAGQNGILKVWVKNTGEQSAESVDVRMLKQNSQPFELDVRSDYIGELEAGESGLAIFNFKVNSDADIKIHDFKLILRSKGDTDEGDDTIYTYNRRASFDVTGEAPNYYLYIGAIGVLILIIVVIFNKKGNKEDKNKK